MQEKFFERLKAVIPPSYSLAQEVADRLGISSDSAYRRLRGETELTFNEAARLASEFGISLDSMLENGSDSVTFQMNGMRENNMDFTSYFEEMRKDLMTVAGIPNASLIYLAREIPVFHFFQVPELAAFRFYFWKKTSDTSNQLESETFNLRNINPDQLEVARDIYKYYLRIPSTEILCGASLSSWMKQIEYSLESGHFENPDDALVLFEKLEDMVNHFKQQATFGEKYVIGGKPLGKKGNFQLFSNDVVNSENLVLVSFGGSQIAIQHSLYNFLRTNDVAFCNYARQTLDQVMRKSVLISEISERERNKYFNRLRSDVRKFKEGILSSGLL
ncbi:MAG: hypothetical protein H6581_09170 [Bacteroidia bacterium]|nr:hypothetical protein [Bacteroidia bacterium]